MEKFFRRFYFSGKITPGFVSLFSSEMITRVASGFFGIFLPIFLYKIFDNNFTYVAYYYLSGFFLYTVFVAFGAQFLNKFGFRRALRIGALLGSLNYLTFHLMDKENLYYLIPINILILVIFRIFHWIPYYVDFAKFTDKKNRGKEISLLAALSSILGIITPLIAGFIIEDFGFETLFIFGILIYSISVIPLITIPKTKEKFSWTYAETWRQLFAKKRRKIILAFMADGAENIIGVVVWPIFIFSVLNENYLAVGAISTSIIAFTVITQLLVGKYADEKRNSGKFLKFGSFLNSFGWIMKIFIVTAFQIFLVDTYHKLTQIFTRTSFDALTFEIAADQGHFVDEFTVLHEMAINIGKIIMLLVIFSVSLFVSLKWTFLLAAVASMMFNLILAQKNSEIKYVRE